MDGEEAVVLRHYDEARPKEAQRSCSISSKVERVDLCSSKNRNELNDDKWLDKFPMVQHQDDSVLEEGQLPDEPENEYAFNPSRKRVLDKTSQSLAFELTRSESADRKTQLKDAAEDSKDTREYDNRRILEMLAKMERRRERFKEPIAPKKEPDKSLQPQSDLGNETTEIKQQRPARKRRWGGN